MRWFVLALALVATPLAAQDDRARTLADIRQDLSVLNVEVQRLRRELSTTGGPSVELRGTSALERIDGIEAELRRLTSLTEELQNRIDRVVADGTNRIGDLEFRLVELEGGDTAALGQTSTLGGGDAPQVAATPPPPATPSASPSASPSAPAGPADDAPQLAAAERADYDRARTAFDEGRNREAADGFARFVEVYPGSPLAAEAHFYRGEALAALGDTTPAARAYLESFNTQDSGDVAPRALLRLGVALHELGQTEQGCVTLGEVTSRFPQSEASLEAQSARASFGCAS